MTSSGRVNEGTLRNAGSSLGSPAHQYGLTCEDHDHERDAVVEQRLSGGDEPPDDQGVHQVGAVGEPAEGMKTFQLSRALMGPGTRCHVLCSRFGSVDRWNRTMEHLSVRAVRPVACKSKPKTRFSKSLQHEVARNRFKFEIIKENSFF